MNTDTLSNNRLIAEFANHKPTIEYCVGSVKDETICYSPKNVGFDWYPEQKKECERWLSENLQRAQKNGHELIKFEWYRHYESDWNDLMPVVEKITQLDSAFRIVIGNVNTYAHFDSQKTKQVNEKPIAAVYSAVVDFIAWYNQNNKPDTKN
jgi:hypothetical protein